MNHSETIFNQSLFSLSYADLTEFFKKKQDENLNLEFKSFIGTGDYNKKENTIKKTVCGMLNSEGGVIVWGAPQESKDAHGNTSAQGDLTPFNSKLDKDRLVNILSSSITPLPIGIKVHEIQNEAGLSVFVIDCPKSLGKPHQFDNLYFIRLDGQTRIAPHYLISALMKSTDFPELRGHVRLKRVENDGNNFILEFNRLLFNASPYINELNVRMRVVVHPGDIYVHGQDHGALFVDDYPLLSNGAPFLTPIMVKIPFNRIHENFEIFFQFGGEKSPSKISRYVYTFNAGSLQFGSVIDESKFINEKDENGLPSDVSSNTVEQNIDFLLSQ